MSQDNTNFRKTLTLINRGVLVGLIIAIGAMFYFPIPEGVSEQQVGWIQGLLTALVIFWTVAGERQTDHWFEKDDDDFIE